MTSTPHHAPDPADTPDSDDAPRRHGPITPRRDDLDPREPVRAGHWPDGADGEPVDDSPPPTRAGGAPDDPTHQATDTAAATASPVPIAIWRLAPRPEPTADTADDHDSTRADPGAGPQDAGRPDPTRPPRSPSRSPSPRPVAPQSVRSATEPPEVFEARLAHWLVLTLTDPGDIVVDLDHPRGHDRPVLAELPRVARDAGRVYLPLPRPHQPCGQDEPPRRVTLFVLRWPRPSIVDSDHVLEACRMLTTPETSIVAVAHPTATPFAVHERHLHEAARRAGLVHVLTIVALPAPDTGDQFLYYATPQDTTTLHSASDTTARASTSQDDADPTPATAWHIDLIVLTTTPTGQRSKPVSHRDRRAQPASDPAVQRRTTTNGPQVPQPPQEDHDGLLTPDEVAAHLKVPAATLPKWRAQRSGPAAFRIGKHLRCRRSAVDSFLRPQEPWG